MKYDEKKLVELRIKGFSQVNIAKELNTTQVTVMRRLKKIKSKLIEQSA